MHDTKRKARRSKTTIIDFRRVVDNYPCRKPPKGFTCECGENVEFAGYVYSHWRERLTHTCPKCGNKHAILMGTAKLIEKGLGRKLDS